MNISLFTRRLFCTHHHRTADYVKRMTAAKDTIEKQTEDIKNLQLKLKQKEKLNQTRNNQVHLMRVRLTEDIQKAQKIWSDAKKQIQKNKSEAVNNFAKGLVVLGNQLNKAKTFEKDQVHSVQLREGFDLTSRLYFSTLQKFNIKSTDIKQNDKLKKGQYQQVGQQKTQKAELKGAVARIVEQGWSIQGKITNLPKIVVYA